MVNGPIKKREVKQIIHYYPFGLTMNGAVNAADSTAYQLNQMKNNLKYTCPPLKCRMIDLDIATS